MTLIYYVQEYHLQTILSEFKKLCSKMLIHFRDEVVLSARTVASRNKVVHIEPALKSKELICKTCIFRKLAFKHGQDCQCANNAISIYVKQKLYLHVHLENQG